MDIIENFVESRATFRGMYVNAWDMHFEVCMSMDMHFEVCMSMGHATLLLCVRCVYMFYNCNVITVVTI